MTTAEQIKKLLDEQVTIKSVNLDLSDHVVDNHADYKEKGHDLFELTFADGSILSAVLYPDTEAGKAELVAEISEDKQGVV